MMLERSVYSARYCFVENLHRRYVNIPSLSSYYFRLFSSFIFSGVLDKMEYGCYCQWFDQVVKRDPPPIDLIGKFSERERDRDPKLLMLGFSGEICGACRGNVFPFQKSSFSVLSFCKFRFIHKITKFT